MSRHDRPGTRPVRHPEHSTLTTPRTTRRTTFRRTVAAAAATAAAVITVPTAASARTDDQTVELDGARIPLAVLEANDIAVPTGTTSVVDEAPAPAQDVIVGEASWYGRYFHGRPTASGAPFDMHALTAAHRTLPLGTVVTVTRVDTGESVEVLVNDRGPYAPGSAGARPHPTRVIDLSFGAAQALDAVDAGVVDVEVEITD